MQHQDRPIEVLFVSEKPNWPLNDGVSLRGYHIVREMNHQGIGVAVASFAALPSDAPEWFRDIHHLWPEASQQDYQRLLAGWSGPTAKMRVRMASHQGVDPRRLAGVFPLIDRLRPRHVVGIGQHSPMILSALRRERGVKRVWYAADEPLLFHLSCLRRERLSGVKLRLRRLALYGALEAIFVRGLDGAIGVSPADTRALRLLAGVQNATTVRNGVCTEYFCQGSADTSEVPNSLAFWGTMDFEPNIDAVTWFARHVWPALRRDHPDATWQIIGKSPHPSVQALAHEPGICVLGATDDIRPAARAASVTILPMRCGAGIKNKLLEAAAMALPIVASRRAVRGLDTQSAQGPVRLCDSPSQWVRSITELWRNKELRLQAGQDARAWVTGEYSWSTAATEMTSWLRSLATDGVDKPNRPVGDAPFVAATRSHRAAA